MNTTSITAAPIRPRHFEQLVYAIPLPFTPWSANLTDYQHAIIGTADQYAKDIVAGFSIARHSRLRPLSGSMHRLAGCPAYGHPTHHRRCA